MKRNALTKPTRVNFAENEVVGEWKSDGGAEILNTEEYWLILSSSTSCLLVVTGDQNK